MVANNNHSYFNDIDQGVSMMSKRIIDALKEEKKVLWLVSGGSNIQISVAVMNRIRIALDPIKFKYLSIGLSDERYGLQNHINSNWRQLNDQGFDCSNIECIPVLDNLELSATAEKYEILLLKHLKSADIIVGQFGIGADGHIAGILPKSPAVESKRLVCAYVSDPYTRITLTPYMIKKIDVAYVYAYGISKKCAISDLRNREFSIEDQPCQILKFLPEVYIFTDQ